MNLRLMKKLALGLLISFSVVACLKNDYESPKEPTKADEQALLKTLIDTLENKGYDVDTTALGVFYVIDSVGTGPKPSAGDECVVRYTGAFINGRVFDTSGKNTYKFTLGDKDLIKGWNDGMKVIKKGGRAHLIIPSEYAYGEIGSRSIPPYTTLIFDIEMVDVKLKS